MVKDFLKTANVPRGYPNKATRGFENFLNTVSGTVVIFGLLDHFAFQHLAVVHLINQIQGYTSGRTKPHVDLKT